MSTSKHEIQDLDLMRYYDGELDDERAAEIGRWLEDGELDDADLPRDGLDKLAGLGLVGDLLAEAADGDERADDVVDAVMAKLDAAIDGDAEDDTDEEAEADRASGDLEAELMPVKQPATPSNDNASRIYMLAVAAAAAAAGLFIWGNQGQEIEPPPHARMAPPATVTAEVTATPRAPVGPAPETLADDDEDDGVEIAAVDFGTHRGSVFYVGDASAGRTAVVWINDAGEP